MLELLKRHSLSTIVKIGRFPNVTLFEVAFS